MPRLHAGLLAAAERGRCLHCGLLQAGCRCGPGDDPRRGGSDAVPVGGLLPTFAFGASAGLVVRAA